MSNKTSQPREFRISNNNGQPFTIKVKGRNRWALECLIASGVEGCTPIDNPAPRWSVYVFHLRKRGIQIETINEPHGGLFKGTHARYVLRSQVSRVERETSAA